MYTHIITTQKDVSTDNHYDHNIIINIFSKINVAFMLTKNLSILEYVFNVNISGLKKFEKKYFSSECNITIIHHYYLVVLVIALIWPCRPMILVYDG